MSEITQIASNYLTTLCRICAKHSDRILDLFNAEHKGEKLVDMLSFCLKQLIHEDDGLPRIICEVCGTKLIMVHEFHTLYSKTEQRFRHILEVSQNNVKVELGYDPCENEIKVEPDEEITHITLLPDVSYFRNHNYFDTYSFSDITHERPKKLKQLNKRKKSAKKLTSHQREPHQSRVKIELYECFECKESFPKFRALKRHTRIHIRQEKPYECSDCKVRFVYLKSFARHRRQKHPTRVFECEYCKDAFATLPKLKQHLNIAHQHEVKAYKCDVCPKTYPLRFQLSYHQLKHLHSQPVSCSFCGESFTQRMLKSHIRDKHTNHLCSECGKTFKTIHQLASHQNLHRSDTPFACDQCPNRFKWKAALTTHMLVHTGQKKHVCDTCGSSFTTKGSLNKHRLIHTGTRPFPCETCTMRFYSKNHLNRHIRTHSGEKPYKCNYCDRAFSQSNDLTKHTRSHVGENMYKCPECPEAFRLQTELRNHSFEHYQATKGPDQNPTN